MKKIYQKIHLIFEDKQFIKYLAAFFAIILAFGIVSFLSFNRGARFNVVNLFNNERPAKLEIVKILAEDCEDCFDAEKIISQVKSSNVKIKKETTLFSQDEAAKALIAEYSIKRLPVFLVFGEINKNNELIFLWKKFGEVRDDVFVFRKVFPPYFDLENGSVKGRFNLTYLTDINCRECYDVTRHETALYNLGLQIRAENSRVIDISSDEGKNLVKKYKVEYAPTIILQGEVNEYAPLMMIWQTVGTLEEDGTLVFREDGEKLMGTYKNIKTGEILTGN